MRFGYNIGEKELHGFAGLLNTWEMKWIGKVNGDVVDISSSRLSDLCMELPLENY